MTELQIGLPPGWDYRFDERIGKYYYVNHYTKTTTWEDPRSRNKPFQNSPKHTPNIPVEHIPLQHGSPEFKKNYVYPSNSPPIQAFRMNSKAVPLQDMKSTTRSPLTLRSAKIKDSSFTVASSHSSTDSDDSVAKIGAMFPTVSETHIKLLLKNCRYMKSIFPTADETIILEILQNNENSIQKTSDILKDMGYNKKETMKPVVPKNEAKLFENEEEKVSDLKTLAPVVPKIKTNEEKEQIKQKLQEEYKDVAEHLICIALESVNFNENRANQILKIMKQDSESENNLKNKNTDEFKGDIYSAPSTTQSTIQLPISQSRQSIKSLLKTEKKDEMNSFSRVIDENNQIYKSSNLCSTIGHNSDLSRGPNEKLLLENYVQWQGSNKSLHKGTQGLAKGPNKNLLSNKFYKPRGPNAEICKGSTLGLVKGSIFAQLKTVVVGEFPIK